jgi:hypothetical protein
MIADRSLAPSQARKRETVPTQQSERPERPEVVIAAVRDILTELSTRVSYPSYIRQPSLTASATVWRGRSPVGLGPGI